LAEVREQVLTHIPVFARPLVLEGKNHPVIWSNVYADGVDPEMTDYKWEVDECEEQREYFQKERKDKHMFQTYSAQYDREVKKNQKVRDYKISYQVIPMIKYLLLNFRFWTETLTQVVTIS
jgi:voltage-dependent calcium channel alpha-2/delta-3